MSAPAPSATTGSIPAVGDVAPDFTADSTAGSPVSLSSFRGKKRVLIAFFPLAFTSTCTAELCDLSDDFDQFTGASVTPRAIVKAVRRTLEYYRANREMLFDAAAQPQS